MASVAKTLVATGASSGLGFEMIKQLLTQSQSWNLILGARDPPSVQKAFDELKYDTSKHSLTLFPLDLSKMQDVKTFAHQALQKVGSNKIDYLVLNAGMIRDAEKKGPHPKWCETYIVNHLSQHYLLHLLKDKLVSSKSRVVVVSSGAIRMVTDVSTLEDTVKDASGASMFPVYGATKFQQLLGAHWWRRQLAGSCEVVAVSPGMVPGTGLSRNYPDFKFGEDAMKDAISVPQGAQNMIRAMMIQDFPEDPEQIFLTSWGEWWPKDVYGLSLDKALQGKWSPSKEEIERNEGIA